MKNIKAMSLMELLVLLMIMGIMVAVGWPALNGFVERSRAREIKILFDVIVTATKFYDMKYTDRDYEGLDVLLDKITDTNFGDPQNVWPILGVAIPPDARYVYYIQDSDDLAHPGPQLVVTSKAKDGVPAYTIYNYVLPDGPGEMNYGAKESKYLTERDLPRDNEPLPQEPPPVEETPPEEPPTGL